MSDDSEPKSWRIPDPTPLTTQQVHREVLHVRELFETRVKSIDTRFDAIDKATELFESNLTRVPTEVEKQVGHLQELMLAKFALTDQSFVGVQRQFDEQAARVKETAEQAQKAIDAALQAAEKAVSKQNEAAGLAIDKSEKWTIKQLEQIGVLIAQMSKASDDQNGDIKDRLTRLESENRGARVQKDDSRSVWAIVIAAGGFIIGVVGVVIALFARGVVK